MSSALGQEDLDAATLLFDKTQGNLGSFDCRDGAGDSQKNPRFRHVAECLFIELLFLLERCVMCLSNDRQSCIYVTSTNRPRVLVVAGGWGCSWTVRVLWLFVFVGRCYMHVGYCDEAG